MSEEVNETGVFVPGDHYWRWRLSIEEMRHAETRLDVARIRAEMKSLEQMLEAYRVKDAKRAVDLCKSEYSKVKEEIEGIIGLSLNDVIIDGHTYEVKCIEKEK